MDKRSTAYRQQLERQKHRYATDPEFRARVAARAAAWQKTNKRRRKEICLGYIMRDPARRRTQARVWQAKQPPMAKRERLFQKRYGLTYAEVIVLWEGQGCSCAICGKPLEFPAKKTHVDHCHASGKVRGILCFNCNQMLGCGADSPDILERAAVYLRRHDVE